MIQVASLPDWREGNQYQALLGQALAEEGFEVIYPKGYRRGFPLARARYQEARLLHLHWPEAYFAPRARGWGLMRKLRFPWDLRLAERRRPLIYTAHNFLPHDDGASWLVLRNYRAILRTAAGVIAHSRLAAQQLAEFCPPAASRIHVVPHGNPAENFPTLPAPAAARQALGLAGSEPVVLVFGRVEPYKGLEEIIASWSKLHPTARLWVAGIPHTPGYAEHLRQLAGDQARVTLELQWLSEADLAQRLAAAEVVLFNYRRIFTSGAGCLARSVGRKIVLPARLDTVDLMEPASTVFRFQTVESDLPAVLARAVQAPADPANTAAWCEATSWRRVAQLTAAIYRRAL